MSIINVVIEFKNNFISPCLLNSCKIFLSTILRNSYTHTPEIASQFLEIVSHDVFLFRIELNLKDFNVTLPPLFSLYWINFENFLPPRATTSGKNSILFWPCKLVCKGAFTVVGKKCLESAEAPFIHFFCWAFFSIYTFFSAPIHIH